MRHWSIMSRLPENKRSNINGLVNIYRVLEQSPANGRLFRTVARLKDPAMAFPGPYSRVETRSGGFVSRERRQRIHVARARA